MNILWYLSVWALFLIAAFALDQKKENKRLKEQIEQEEPMEVYPRRFRSIKA